MIDYFTNLLSLSNFLILDFGLRDRIVQEGGDAVVVDNVTTLHCRILLLCCQQGCWMRAFTPLFCIHMSFATTIIVAKSLSTRTMENSQHS